MKLDPILLEIMGAKVAAVAEEMYFALQRASRSGYVKEAADFATAILDVDGLLFAHPPSATFNFLIDCNYASTIRAVPDVEPGDVRGTVATRLAREWLLPETICGPSSQAFRARH